MSEGSVDVVLVVETETAHVDRVRVHVVELQHAVCSLLGLRIPTEENIFFTIILSF